MLLWLCNEEQQQHQLQQLQQFYQLQLQQLSQITGSDQTQAPTPTTANSPSSQLAQLIQQFSTTANNSQTTALSTSATAAASSANFKFNRADLDRLRTYLTATTAVNASSSYVVPTKTNSALLPLPLLPRYHRVHRGLATAHPKACQHQEHARDPPLAHHALLCGRRRKPDRRSETRVFLRSHQVPLQGPQRVLPGAHVPLGQQVVHNPRELLALRDSSQHPVSDTRRRQSTAEEIRRATGLGSSWGSGYSKPDRQQQYQQYRVQSSFVASSFHPERARCQSSVPGSYAGRLNL